MSDTPANHLASPLPVSDNPQVPRFEQFRLDSGNANFKVHFFTFFSLAFLILGYPGMSLIGIGEDPLKLLKDLDQAVLLMLLLVTIVFQWGVFLLIFGSTWAEKTGLTGLGFTKFRPMHVAWAVTFLLVSNLILSGLAWFLGQIGHPMPGEIGLLIPQDPFGKVVWVAVSATAGFCEESMFRGYLMTRLRLVGKLQGWVVATIVSAIAFGACHAYQGLPGFIVITVYGAMFSLLYIRTGSIWPGIIAHFLQDTGALFYPR